jgi:hypothetical protein
VGPFIIAAIYSGLGYAGITAICMNGNSGKFDSSACSSS